MPPHVISCLGFVCAHIISIFLKPSQYRSPTQMDAKLSMNECGILAKVVFRQIICRICFFMYQQGKDIVLGTNHL